MVDIIGMTGGESTHRDYTLQCMTKLCSWCHYFVASFNR